MYKRQVHVLFKQCRLHEPVELPTVRSLEVAELDNRHGSALVAGLVGWSRREGGLHHHWGARGAASGERAAGVQRCEGTKRDLARRGSGGGTRRSS